ncbi:winged helix DNA-binding domain-containing protein [Cellulomonas sp. H30R-01]|uniref:winged helix DNA-binding domain-containing protein n=1 Tax=Cellulomonas sp. H30R-01 TaxID=2704467 RepID=UPI00138D6A85|nr:winged helix DNA-binding domain-containing protein [Cellulomonas sp. H30R-01]QHT56302.1 winged helix DNA-binding domain-containing protein [Cellulomonas sp. H30R-01]
MAEPPLMDRRALNRALLARQHLLERTDASAVDVVGHLVGLQAQNVGSPYVGLWSRVEGFTHADLGDALLDRRLARIAVMRGTIHLVDAADALLLPGLVAPLYARDLVVNTLHSAPLRTVDLAEVTAFARELVEAEPRVSTALGKLLAERWPHVPPASLAHAARGTLPLVQVPPRGVWGRSGATTWTTTTAWFGADAAAAPDLSDPDVLGAELERLVLRYLAAFGPASVTDAQAWSGLTGLAAVVARLGDRVVRFTAEPSPGKVHPREVLDLPDAPRPPADVPAPVRFLPDLDNVLLSHADRTRVVAEEHRRALQSPNGVVPGTVLVDGVVAATWRVERVRVEQARARRRRERATLVVEPFGELTARERRDVVAEAERFVTFVADDAVGHDVEVR